MIAYIEVFENSLKELEETELEIISRYFMQDIVVMRLQVY